MPLNSSDLEDHKQRSFLSQNFEYTFSDMVDLVSHKFEINRNLIRDALGRTNISFERKYRFLMHLLELEIIENNTSALRKLFSEFTEDCLDNEPDVATTGNGILGVGITSYSKIRGIDGKTLRKLLRDKCVEPIVGTMGRNSGREFPLYNKKDVDCVLTQYGMSETSLNIDIPKSGLIETKLGVLVAPITYMINQRLTYVTAEKVLAKIKRFHSPIRSLRGMSGPNVVDLFFLDKIKNYIPIKLDEDKKALLNGRFVGSVATELYKRGFTVNNKATLSAVLNKLKNADIVPLAMPGINVSEPIDLYYIDEILPYIPYRIGKDAHVIGKEDYVCLEKYLKIHGLSSYDKRRQIEDSILGQGIKPCRKFTAINHGAKADVYELALIEEFLPEECRTKKMAAA